MSTSSLNAVSVAAPLSGTIESIEIQVGELVEPGNLLITLESMKVHVRVEAPQRAKVTRIAINLGDQVERGQALVDLDVIDTEADGKRRAKTARKPDGAQEHSSIPEWRARQALAHDSHRPDQAAKRHAKGYSTARENLANLCDPNSFDEYGQFAVAAQRQRRDYETLKSATAADGVITGFGKVAGVDTALIINDYSVLAGTQGFFHHQKIDRILDVAKRRSTPVIMFTEGGGGRPGETDVTTVNSGLQCATFGTWAGLSGRVPRIAIANGYNFAGNAALFGAADITIATNSACIGMAGPAMIAGGGLGEFKPTEIGPLSTQRTNGVVDIVMDNEPQACDMAKRLVSHLCNSEQEYSCDSQAQLRAIIPENRRQTFDVRKVIQILADKDSCIELQVDFGTAVVTSLAQIEGKTVGIIANDCAVLGGAVDVHAGRKANRFMQLCDKLKLPIVSLCDTPGFMVGPEHEASGAVRVLPELFTTGAQVSVPFYAVVLRKCYGLGAQAMLGGGTTRPDYMMSWPTGEFGAMGLEGAVKLGFKSELDAQPDKQSRKELFDKLLAQQYQRGQAIEVASVLELDAVVDPATTRDTLARLLKLKPRNK